MSSLSRGAALLAKIQYRFLRQPTAFLHVTRLTANNVNAMTGSSSKGTGEIDANAWEAANDDDAWGTFNEDLNEGSGGGWKEPGESALSSSRSNFLKNADKFRVNPTPDMLYDPTIDHFAKLLMKDGRRALADRIIRDVLMQIKKTNIAEGRNEPPTAVLKAAFDNAKPLMETRSVQTRSGNVQVPAPIREVRREWLAMKWIIKGAKNMKKPNGIANRLYTEVMSCYREDPECYTLKKRTEVHKQALTNRANAQYRLP